MQHAPSISVNKDHAFSTGIQSKSRFFEPIIHPKLIINQPGDSYEQEADAVAERVMRMPETKNDALFFQARPISVNPIQRKCLECEQEEEESKVQMKTTSVVSGGLTAPPIVHDVINSGGQPMDITTRNFMEARLGYDFGNVEIHNDSNAHRSSADINARAYTHGRHVVFGVDQYQPHSNKGKQLLVHELVHVIQQQSSDRNVVRRDLSDDAQKLAELYAIRKLADLADKPAGPHSGFTGESHCHPKFCQPFADSADAAEDLLWAGPLILAGIAKKISSRLVPLWYVYLQGGSSSQLDLTKNFGPDFTNSPTTAKATQFVVEELQKDISANHATLMGGSTVITLDFTARFASTIKRLEDSNFDKSLNFNVIADIAGNIAGGIGKDQNSIQLGAKPNRENDSREATFIAKLVRNADGSITITPRITYTVKDTIDLCPGNCGEPREQTATVPLSRFEATGLTGDVPIKIQFDAPAAGVTPMRIVPPPPPHVAVPVPGVVSTSLRIRSAPDTSSATVGSYSSGMPIIVLCQSTGSVVKGSNVWYKTNLGFVSSSYVSLFGWGIPDVC